MKIFIWNYLVGITDNYHDGGGIAAIASDLESARKMLDNESANEQEPDFSAELVGEHKSMVIVFPDSGCC